MRGWIPRLMLAGLVVLLLPVSVQAKEDDDSSRMKSETFAGLELRSIGPALMSGRIADIAVHPTDRSLWYVAVGSGNIWKTTNSGTTWTPIFDDQGSYSIGCITIDPNRPETIWVGTGENVGGRHVGYGDGVYRSLDGGMSWENLGLKETEHIGNIVIDPRDSNVVYVAAQGPLWSAGGERGLYKTTDGGKTWEQILAKGEYTGVNEVHLDPRNPDVLYAATHQRFRNVAALINGGPESGIHKSTDGGKTWRELTNGLPSEEKGKIGLALAPENPDIVYATVELAHREGGFYRSMDGGESWEKRNDYLSGGTGPHYYQELFADPHHPGRVYQMDAPFMVTDDGGANFRSLSQEVKHGDNHALAFNPDDPNYLLNGTDGGLYESWDEGKTFKFVANLPVTQFYKVAVDYDEPFYNIYGGTQDNNSQGGPSRTLNVHGIRNSDWFVTLFGDGHQSAVDYSNPDIVYSEWQEGNLVRYDRKTGEIVYIQPQPEKGEPAERFNWDSPILISAHDPARIYFASQRVWRSDNRGDSWKAISGDLSKGEDRIALPMMGRVQSYDAIWDLWAMSNYATITSLAESPKNENLLYAGTDDGLIQVSENGGESWTKIEAVKGIPAGAFVNDIKADLHDENTVYVALDAHKSGDFAPYLIKSTDRGKTWKSMTGDLPERHLVWRIVQDHIDPNLFFLGTEFGVFFSPNAGENWIELTGNVPNISFRDLAIQKRENDLVGATFGRSFYVFDDYSPLRGMSEEMLEKDAILFPVKDALWYVQRRTLGGGEKASQGDAFYTAPNPDFGAIFTYYLRDSWKSLEDQRKEKEAELAEEGKDTPYPGYDALREERNEDEAAIVFTVTDADGEIVRRFTGETGAGFHRVAWDLSYPTTDPWNPDAGEDFLNFGGPMAPPGTYSVQMAQRVDGEMMPLGEPQTFEVVALEDTTLPRADPVDTARFMRRLAEVQRVGGAIAEVMEATDTRLEGIRQTVLRSDVPDSLYADTIALQRRLAAMRESLDGDSIKGDLGEPAPHSISERMWKTTIGNIFSTYGPTPTHKRQLEIAEQELADLKKDLEQLVEVDLEALSKAMDDAGAPWTPGRGIPDGN